MEYFIRHKTIVAAVVALLFSSQMALAQKTKHSNRYYKQFRYAKEEFIPQPRFWGGIEYMSMWEQNGPLTVPLVTQNPNPFVLGAIDEVGTNIIYGNGSGQNLNYYNSNGGRLTLGGWIDDYHLYGLEFNGFLLEKVYTNFDAAAHGGTFPVVSIPFFETSPSPGESAVSAFGNPNAVSVNTSSQLWGAELNLIYNLSNMLRYPTEVFAGFRFMSLDETLSLNDTIFDTTPPVTNGVVSFTDDFNTQNNFYGLELGARTKIVTQYKITLDVIAKVALGANAELIDISGNTQVVNGGLGQTTGIVNGGIFSQQSNTGSFTHNTFAVLPEAQIKLGYMLAPNVHPYVSYDVIYLNNVVRPGQQINRNINITENPVLSGATAVTGPLSPTKPSFNETSFVVQGLTVGLEITF